jgi:Family of unknown function (DUF5752)
VLEFAIKDCALSIIATGRRAQTLRELRNVIRDVHPGSIYHHFWGTLQRPLPVDREYNNDFATWCYNSLHDAPAAERLAVIDPAEYSDLEELRQELIEVIDERLDETELMLFTQADQQFHFARAIIVVFDTHRVLTHPRELLEAVPRMSVGSIFYHFVDARRREPVGKDDFSAWLMGMGAEYSALIDSIGAIDPFFESLFVMRDRLTHVLAQHFHTPAGLNAGAAARKTR